MLPLSPPRKTARFIGLTLLLLLNAGHLLAYAQGYDTIPQLLIFIVSLFLLPWLCATKGDSENNETQHDDTQNADALWPQSPGIWPQWSMDWKTERWIFASLMIVGVFLRFYRWDSMPAGIWADELLASANGVRILDGIEAKPFGTLPLIAEWPQWVHTFNPYSYYVAANLKVFGVNHFGIKMLSIIPGCLTIAGFYWLLRELGGKRWAIIGTLLLSFSRWHLTQARFEWDATFAVAGAVIGLAAMVRALRTAKWHWMAIGGIFIGLTQFSYLASRLAAAGALGWLLVMLVIGQHKWTGFRRRVVAGLVVWGLAFGIAAGPVIVFSLVNEDIAKARIKQVSIEEKHKGAEDEAFVTNLEMYAKMFTVTGPKNARQNIPKAPLLPSHYHLLFYLGGLLCLWPGFGIKNPLSWTVLGCALMGGILSDNNDSPNSHRVGLALPMAYIWITIAIDWLITGAGKLSSLLLKEVSEHAKTVRIGLYSALVLLVSVPSAVDTYDYFVNFGGSKAHWRATRAAEQLHLAKAVIPYQDTHHLWIDFLFWDKTLDLLLWVEPSDRKDPKVGSLDNPQFTLTHFSPRTLLPKPEGKKPILLAVHPSSKKALRQQLPNAKWKVHKDPWGRDMFFTLEVRPDRLRQARKRGLKNAKFVQDEAFLTQRDLKGKGALRLVYGKGRQGLSEAHIDRKNALKKAPQGPLTRQALPMEWHAYLNVEEAGNYLFKGIKASYRSNLYIDGKRVSIKTGAKAKKVSLSAGSHSLLFKSTLNTYNRVSLQWMPPGRTEFEDIPNDFLSPRKPRGFARHKAPGKAGGKGKGAKQKGKQTGPNQRDKKAGPKQKGRQAKPNQKGKRSPEKADKKSENDASQGKSPSKAGPQTE